MGFLFSYLLARWIEIDFDGLLSHTIRLNINVEKLLFSSFFDKKVAFFYFFEKKSFFLFVI